MSKQSENTRRKTSPQSRTTLAPALSNINQNKHKYVSPSTHVRCANTHTNTINASLWSLNETLGLKRAVLICSRHDMNYTMVCVCVRVWGRKRESASVYEHVGILIWAYTNLWVYVSVCLIIVGQEASIILSDHWEVTMWRRAF